MRNAKSNTSNLPSKVVPSAKRKIPEDSRETAPFTCMYTSKTDNRTSTDTVAENRDTGQKGADERGREGERRRAAE